jgi:hypothetical protein
VIETVDVGLRENYFGVFHRQGQPSEASGIYTTITRGNYRFHQPTWLFDSHFL